MKWLTVLQKALSTKVRMSLLSAAALIALGGGNAWAADAMIASNGNSLATIDTTNGTSSRIPSNPIIYTGDTIRFGWVDYPIITDLTLRIFGDAQNVTGLGKITTNTNGEGNLVFNLTNSANNPFSVASIGAQNYTLKSVTNQSGIVTIAGNVYTNTLNVDGGQLILNGSSYATTTTISNGELINKYHFGNKGTFTIGDNGKFSNYGGIYNTGVMIINGGEFNNLYVFTNETNGTVNGTFTNHGGAYFHNYGNVNSTITNSGTFENISFIHGDTKYTGAINGAVKNTVSGIFTNGGEIIGKVTNEGTFKNEHTFQGITYFGEITGAVTNSGTFTNKKGGNVEGAITNSGTFNNETDGILKGAVWNSKTFNNSGEITGAVTNLSTFANGTAGNIDGVITNFKTFTNYGEISGLITNSSTFTNYATGFLGGGVLNLSGTFDNRGDVTGLVTNSATFTNSGKVDGAVINSNKFTNSGDVTGLVTNSKTFTNMGSGSLLGGVLNLKGTFENSGEITGLVTNSATFNNNGGKLLGAVLNSDGVFTNTSGEITGLVTNSATFNNNGGKLLGAVLNSDGTFENSGEITGLVTNSATFNNNGGKLLGAVLNSGEFGDFENSGEITGLVTNSATFNNGGKLLGAVLNSDGTFENSGEITGLVTNSATFNNDGGKLLGAVLNSGGEFTNTSGEITGLVTNSATFNNGGKLLGAVLNSGKGGDFTNSGEIAILITNSDTATFTNKGNITAVVLNSAMFDNENNILGLVVNSDAGNFTNSGLLGGMVTNSATFNNNTGGNVIGTVDNSGDFENSGLLGGMVTNSAKFTNDTKGIIGAMVTNNQLGNFTNRGSIGAEVKNSGNFTNDGILVGAVTNLQSGTFTNKISVNGLIDNSGTFNNNGLLLAAVTNSGAFDNKSNGNIGATVINLDNATFTNSGNIGAEVKNYGTFTNDGILLGAIKNYAGGYFVNSGDIGNALIPITITNSGKFTNSKDVNSTSITNSKTFTNDGNIAVISTVDFTKILNPKIVAGVIDNSGTFENNGTIENLTLKIGNVNLPLGDYGVITNTGMFNNSGSIKNIAFTNNSGEFTNTGIYSGDLRLVGGTFTNSGEAKIGTLTVSAPATLNLYNTTNATSASISGGATLNIGVAEALAVTGKLNYMGLEKVEINIVSDFNGNLTDGIVLLSATKGLGLNAENVKTTTNGNIVVLSSSDDYKNAISGTLAVSKITTEIYQNTAGLYFNDNKLYYLGGGLVWNNALDNAHGTFKVESNDFTVNSALKDRVEGDEFNNSLGWDGKSLTKDGAGTLILAGANTYSGDTTIENGTLEITGSLGAKENAEEANYAKAISLANNAKLVMNQKTDQTLSGKISGTGSLVKKDAGQLSLTGGMKVGEFNVDAGKTILGDNNTVGNLKEYQATSTAVNSSTLQLQGGKYNLGAITVTAGTLDIFNGARGIKATDDVIELVSLTLNGGVLAFTGKADATAMDSPFAITLTGAGIYDVSAKTGNINAIVNQIGAITGTGKAFTKTGLGQLNILGGMNVGAFTVNAGKTILGSNSAGDLSTYVATTTNVANSTLTIQGGNYALTSVNVGEKGRFEIENGGRSISSTELTAFNLNGGVLAFTGDYTAKDKTNGGMDSPFTIALGTNGGTYEVSAKSATNENAIVKQVGAISGVGSLTKTGEGTLIVSKVEHTGDTTISAGKLENAGSFVNSKTFTNNANFTNSGAFNNTGTYLGNLTLTGGVFTNDNVATIGILDVAKGAALTLNKTATATSAIISGGAILNIGVKEALTVTGKLDYTGSGSVTIKVNSDIDSGMILLSAATLGLTNSNTSVSSTKYTNTASLDFTAKTITFVGGGLIWNNTINAHGTFEVANGGNDFVNGVLADNTTGTRINDWNGRSLTKTGSGVLTLNGANTYSGNTNVDAGKLVIANNFTNQATMTVANRAELELSGVSTNNTVFTNSGTFTNNGLLTLANNSTFNGGSFNSGNINFAGGKMNANAVTVTGNLTFDLNEKYIQTANKGANAALTVNSITFGSGDSIYINAKADVDKTYELIKTTSDEKAAITAAIKNNSGNIYTYEALFNDGLYSVSKKIEVKPSNDGKPAEQGGFNETLEKLLADKSNKQLDAIRNGLQDLSPDDYNEAFVALNGANSATASATMTAGAAQAFNTALGQVFSGAHSASTATSSMAGNAKKGGDGSSANANGRGKNSDNKSASAGGVPMLKNINDVNCSWGGFAKGYGGWGQNASTTNNAGYDFGGAGALIGVDYKFANELKLGAIFGYSFNQSTLYRELGSAVDNVLRLGLTAQYNLDKFYFNTAPTFGIHMLETKRNIHFVNENTVGSRTGFDFNWFNQVGYTYEVGGFLLTPSYALAMTYMHDPEYSERTTESNAHLTINEYNTWSLTQNLELKLGRTLCVGERLTLLPEIFIGWEHEYLTANDVSMAFAVNPGNAWKSPVARLASDRLTFGAGISTIISDRYEIFGRWDQKIWDGGFNTNFTAGVGVKF